MTNDELRHRYRAAWYDVHGLLTTIEQIITEDYPQPDNADTQPTRYDLDLMARLKGELAALVHLWSGRKIQMTITTLRSDRFKTNSNPTDRFEKWIQAPLTNYRSAQIGEKWQLYLVEPVTLTSASQVAANVLPTSLTTLFRSIAKEEERRLISDWLAIAESTFDFWDNDLDADYDNL